MTAKYKHIIRTALGIIILIASCKKETGTVPAGSFYLKQAADADTAQYDVVTDTGNAIITVRLEAISDKAYGNPHRMYFKVDSTLLTTYRQQYGEATLLPATSYVFIHSVCNIPAGALASDPAELNVVNQSGLVAGLTYVLPVVLTSADGDAQAIKKDNNTFYIVVKGKRASGTPLDQTGWTIVSASSQLSPAANVLDNDNQTVWFADSAPQNVVIDMNEQHNILAVTYAPYEYMGQLTVYNPTQIQIEISLDGTSWVNEGTFAISPTDFTNNKKIFKFTPALARFIRFTVLTAGGEGQFLIGDIGVNEP